MIPVKITQLSTNKNPIHLTLDVGWVEKYKTVTGNPIVISDGVKDTLLKKLQMALTPIQDLHGYDKPWVGGAGKNLFDVSYLTGQSANGVYFTAQNDGRVKASGTAVTQGWTYINRSFTLPYNGIDAGDQILLYGSAQLYVRFYDDTYAQVGSAVTRQPSNTATTTVPSSTTKMEIYVYTGYTYPSAGQTVNETLEFYISKDLTFTSWTPYSNICPISGWDEVETVVSGVNVWDEEWEIGGINTSGQETSTSGYYRSKNYTAVLLNTTYYFKVPTTMSVMFYDSNKDFIEWTTANNATVTTPSNCRYLRFRNTTANTWTPYDNDISINYPSTDHDYHAYQGHTYTTDLPQTVYGGTLDVVSGVLTVDRAMVDLGTLNWYYTASNDFFYTGSGVLSDRKAGSTNFICSSYNNIGNVYDSGMKTAETGSIAGGAGSTQIKVKDTRYTDAASFKTAMSGVQLVYELATPTTIQCDPQTVSLLAGENVIMGDGDMEITYRVKASA